MTYRIGIARKGTDQIKRVCPGEWQTEFQIKGEILWRNSKFPLAPGMERVVLVREG
jgi:hypothetical protein